METHTLTPDAFFCATPRCDNDPCAPGAHCAECARARRPTVRQAQALIDADTVAQRALAGQRSRPAERNALEARALCAARLRSLLPPEDEWLCSACARAPAACLRVPRGSGLEGATGRCGGEDADGTLHAHTHCQACVPGSVRVAGVCPEHGGVAHETPLRRRAWEDGW